MIYSFPARVCTNCSTLACCLKSKTVVASALPTPNGWCDPSSWGLSAASYGFSCHSLILCELSWKTQCKHDSCPCHRGNICRPRLLCSASASDFCDCLKRSRGSSRKGLGHIRRTFTQLDSPHALSHLGRLPPPWPFRSGSSVSALPAPSSPKHPLGNSRISFSNRKASPSPSARKVLGHQLAGPHQLKLGLLLLTKLLEFNRGMAGMAKKCGLPWAKTPLALWPCGR